MAAARVPVKVGNRTLSFSNLDKVLFPRDGYTKGDLIDYYRGVSEIILPHLRNRPLTLQRYPDGIDGISFFEKKVPVGAPDWVERITTTSAEAGKKVTYVICNDEATLAYVANLASIVLHVWTSRVPELDEPDFVFFDLDPGERCSLKTLADVALHTQNVLGEIGLEPLVKTSGGLGLHVFVPLAAGYSYESVKLFAELAARRIAAKSGDAVTLARAIKARNQEAVYLDFVQVGRGKTYVPAYGVRARDGAPVSTPLTWDEVAAFARKRGTTAPWDEFAKHTIATIGKRIAKYGDLWGGKAWKKQKLEPAIKRAQKAWA